MDSIMAAAIGVETIRMHGMVVEVEAAIGVTAVVILAMEAVVSAAPETIAVEIGETTMMVLVVETVTKEVDSVVAAVVQ